MAPAHHDIDLASLVPNVTDALGVDTPPASSSPTAGFTLHKATMGQETVLVKVFSGLPQGCLPLKESRAIAEVYLCVKSILTTKAYVYRHFLRN